MKASWEGKEYGVTVTTYGCENADVNYRAVNESFFIDGGMKTHFDVITKDSKYSVEVGVPGKFSVFNALCAFSCAATLGIEFDFISKALWSKDSKEINNIHFRNK